ncbi:DUF4185 domain-containing protein [Pedobacter sp. JCM 36344]|uniref:DUF4185 domain-containing protein n=1 Tax=Pedobacter sp. JCM 36344 TaxID=3374280 RepID=UPI00397AC1B4
MRLLIFNILICCFVITYTSFGQSIPKELIPTDVRQISRVTGKSEANELLPNPNTTDKHYDVGGTDLGIAWDMGNGKTGFFFGDTYGRDFKSVPGGGPGKAGNWRSNVLGISTDKNLNDGLTFDTMIAHELIPSPHITNGTGSHTAIPTAAINIKGTDYVHYMDVRKWGGPGSWTTNYSGIFQSKDQGLNWIKCPTVRFSDTSNFAQIAYAKSEGFIFMLGTPAGRSGAAYLARFKEEDILQQPKYEYWNKWHGWLKEAETLATPIIEGPIGEASLLYNLKYKRWVVTYMNEKEGTLVMRDALEVSGIWSSEKILANARDYPGFYGAFMIPASSRGNEIYFNMSMWFPYNVFLMQATLKFAD